MKSIIVLAALLGLAAAGSLTYPKDQSKMADKDFLYRQKKIFDLLNHIYQIDFDSEYYKYAKDFKFSPEMYTNKKAAEEFWYEYEHGMLPKGKIFSIFYEEMREEAISLFHLFYYAKDFETFYKTACWARVYMNEGMFVYALQVAVFHREDLHGIILPPLYEIYPWFFVSTDVINKMYRIRMQDGLQNPSLAHYYGIDYKDNVYTFYANYTGWYTEFNHEQKISYFTEDIGLNSYYYYFHADYPFWMGGEEYGLYKDRRGELYYYFHQQLLARYYMERLTNGLGEIPKFSWYWPIKTGYYPSLSNFNGYPFPVRHNYYKPDFDHEYHSLNFVTDYEKFFRDWVDAGEITFSKDEKFDLEKPETFDFFAQFFFGNGDVMKKYKVKDYPKIHSKSYELYARYLLGNSGKPFSDYYVGPSALEQYETSVRDPLFWQFYGRIISYFIKAKQHLEPYTKHELEFPGVKVEEVKVDKLVTYFDYFDWDATNAVYFEKEHLHSTPYKFHVRQPRLDNKPFSVTIDVAADKDVEAVVKIFLGPKYDSYGKELSFDENNYNLFELDRSVYQLSAGKNIIVRKSEDFFDVVEDRTMAYELYKKFEAGQLELDMSEAHNGFPERLLLPKGTKGGFPFQIYVFVYPYQAAKTPYGSNFEESYYSGVGTGARYFDDKAFGYPLDRPIDESYFFTSNMFVEDVYIYHEGEEYVHNFGKYGYVNTRDNIVHKE